MPVGRYFLCVGSVLMALLFVADWCLPPSDAGRMRSGVDRSTIRIHSAHRWPKAVVFDTTLPTLVPPQATVTAAAPAPPLPQPAREAYAMAETTLAAKPIEAAKPVKHRVRRATGGRNQGYDTFGFGNDMAGPRRFAFRNEGFGFGRNTWRSSW